MKKLYTLLAIALIGFVGNAQIVNIPDANFKAKLLAANSSLGTAKNLAGNYFQIDANSDGQIQTSEALQVSYLYLADSSISDLTGISSFTNIKYLYFPNNQLSNLNVSTLTLLMELDCTGNLLSSLNVNTLNNLQILKCSGNTISSLNLNLLSSLVEVYCQENTMNSIILDGCTSLQRLDCGYNLLVALDISNLTNIIRLNCFYNQITSLNANNLAHLKYLACDHNQLSSISLNNCNVLYDLYCYNNSLTTLNVSGLSTLYTLDCKFNQLSTVNLDGCISLNSGRFDNNSLSVLDMSSNYNLVNLYCTNNTPLTSVFIKNGKYQSIPSIFSGNPNLSYICCDEIEYLDLSTFVNTYNPYVQVNTYCSFTPGGVYYTIQGNSKYDLNGNGCDVADLPYGFLKINRLVNNNLVGVYMSNSSGSYTLPVQAGSHKLVPILENPTYFTISPANTTITFPTQASPFNQNFCLAANGNHNDLEIALFPLVRARPGFDATYIIIYKNKGTGTQSGTVNLTFDDTLLDLVSATPSVTTQAANNLSWSFSNLLPFETREILLTLNVNAPTETPAVNAGDVLSYSATVTGTADETPNDNTSTLSQTAVNSLDPNDKICVEGTTVSPGMVGQYVHYVVRFENDGTANAQNIVVKDMIDTTKFDVSTLVPLSGSAPFTTRIINTNQVEFVFQNINLPYTAGTNTGYVAFKIKTKPTLVVGDTFSNSASIFFDYNAPIVTNTATTTITALATQDFDFGTYFSVYPNPAKQVLNLETKATIGVNSINIYNLLGQMVIAIPNAESVSAIDVSDLKTGTYCIKVNTDKGMANAKFIKE